MNTRTIENPGASILDMTYLNGPENKNCLSVFRVSPEEACLQIRTHKPTSPMKQGPGGKARDMVATVYLRSPECDVIGRFLWEVFSKPFKADPRPIEECYVEQPATPAITPGDKPDGERAEAGLTNRWGQEVIELRIHSFPLAHTGKSCKRTGKQEITIPPDLLPEVLAALKKAGQAYEEGREISQCRA